MNRAQREDAARDKAIRKSMWPGGFIDTPSIAGLVDGDKFTIQGICRFKDGRITRNCKAGFETVFVARECV